MLVILFVFIFQALLATVSANDMKNLFSALLDLLVKCLFCCREVSYLKVATLRNPHLEKFSFNFVVCNPC